MDPLIGGSIISAAGNFLGNVLGFGSQAATNKANLKLAQYQYEKNLEMWNRQNEYNTPSAQMQRLSDAGLNPNLVYGHGSIANTSSSAPEYKAPTLQAYTNFGSLGSDAISGAMAFKELKKKDAEIDLLKSQKSKTDEEKPYIRVQKELGEENIKLSRLYQDLRKLDKEAKTTENKYQEEQIKLDIEETQLKIKSLQYQLSDVMPAQVDNIISSTNLHNAQTTQTNYITENEIPERIKNLKASTIHHKASAAKEYASIEEIRAHARFINDQADRFEALTPGEIRKQTSEIWNIVMNDGKRAKFLPEEYQQYCDDLIAKIRKSAVEIKSSNIDNTRLNMHYHSIVRNAQDLLHILSIVK